MNKVLGKTICICVLISILIISYLVLPQESHAASAGKVKYKVCKIDKTKNYKGGKYKTYHQYVQIKGKTKAIKKINKHLKNRAKKFMNKKSNRPGKGWEKLINTDYKNRGYKDTYLNLVRAKVSYNKKGYISIKYTQEWYAGGVYNYSIFGETYNVKTGKIQRITSMAHKKYFDNPYGKYVDFRDAIYNKIRKVQEEGEQAAEKYLEVYNTEKKIKKQQYYLNKKGNVVCTFPQYELASGAAGVIRVALRGRLR